jgi:hypothetical protein
MVFAALSEVRSQGGKRLASIQPLFVLGNVQPQSVRENLPSLRDSHDLSRRNPALRLPTRIGANAALISRPAACWAVMLVVPAGFRALIVPSFSRQSTSHVHISARATTRKYHSIARLLLDSACRET